MSENKAGLTIEKLVIRNLLSFGGSSEPIFLHSLNVLIGPNGSGKSNIIETLGLLNSLPKDLADAIRVGGGITDWLWKGESSLPVATVEAVVRPIKGNMPLRYSIKFTRSGYLLEVTDERLENERPYPGKRSPYFYFAHVNGRPMLNVMDKKRELKREDINPQMSVLSQRKDPDHYPELTHIGRVFENMRIYRDWEFGGLARVRENCSADLPNEFLEEDGSNLGMVLSRLLADPQVNKDLVAYLKLFYEDAADIHTRTQQGTVEVSLEEKHLKGTIPLKRLSDGTIRWLALLAILLNPSPSSLVCIEEPELGLHPDMIHELGKLLLKASERMQLIITTHSDALIEEFTEHPEDVLVCEKTRGQTQVNRLDATALGSWLKDYSLGQLWRKGEIGGNRW